MSNGMKAVEHLNKQVNVDQLEELKDKIEEQQADMQERADFFIRAGQVEDEDELLDELNELEAQMAEDELDALDIGSKPIGVNAAKVNVNAGPARVQNEEDELKALEQMMAWKISILEVLDNLLDLKS